MSKRSRTLFTSTQWIDCFILFTWTQWTKGIGCLTYKSKPPTTIKWICHDGFLFMNVGIRVLFDQCRKDPTSCSHQLMLVIISSTCHLEHNESHKLVVVHEFNLDIYIMFFHWCYYVDHCAKFKVLFYEGLGDPKHYSIEHNELTISYGCWFEPSEPKELVAHHTNLDIHQPNQVIISSIYSLEHDTHNELTVIHLFGFLNIMN